MAKHYEISGYEWKQIKELFPKENTGKPRKPLKDNRTMLNAIASRILQPLFSAAFKPSFIKIPHFFSKKHLTNQSKNAALRAS